MCRYSVGQSGFYLMLIYSGNCQHYKLPKVLVHIIGLVVFNVWRVVVFVFTLMSLNLAAD